MICNYSLLELINGPFYIASNLFFMFTEKQHLKVDIGRANETAGASTRAGRYRDVWSPS